MNRLYLTLSIILFFLFSIPVDAQISLDCNDNADQLVNYLVDGIAFSNATVSGFDCSTGYFEGDDLNSLEQIKYEFRVAMKQVLPHIETPF